jgi:hypothetical protein
MVHTPIKTTALVIDKEQATTQLMLLGYQPGDNVYMRFFVPDTDPRYGTPAAARKTDKLNWEEVERYQNDGYGVYFVINGGGHKDSEVKVGRALFCEWDDRPIEKQIFAWQNLNLLEPTMQIGTRKSVHNYWRADLTKDQWIELQQDLLAYTQSDQTLKNPSRVLRLAGCWHIKPGCEPVPCDIIHQSDKVYTYEELRAAIPRRQQPEQPAINYQPSISDDVPLYQFLTKDDRALIDQGAGQGSRNDSGAKLARNLIGTAQRLNHLGIRFSDDPRSLFHDYCHRCNPSISYSEAEAIWKSADKDNPTPSLTDTALENCAKAWLRNQERSSGRGYSSGIGSGGGNHRGGSGGSGGGDGGNGDGGDRTGKVVRFPSFEALTPEQVTGRIDELIAQGAIGSYLTGQLNRLSAASQIYIQELRTLYSQRLTECDLESDRDDNKSQVENLLNLGDRSLELQDYLPEELANPLNLWCNWLSIRPEVVFTALLTGASSLHKVGTKLVIHRNQTFDVPPTLFAGLVSESGQKKSPVLWNIIRHPLNELRQEKIDAYNAAMEDYKAQMQAWEQSENKGQKPELPKDPTLYYFTNATGEAIPIQASKAPEKALLALIDELSGLFNSANSYRGGRGSDKQDTLSYFDGSGQTVLRAGGVKVDVRKIYLSIFGTIQPEVLKNHIADCSDPDGQWARFLFVNQPLESATLSDDDGQFVQIRDRITGFYRQIDRLPEMEYRLSRPAFQRYQCIYNQLEKLRVTHPRAGMRAVYSKMEGYIGRLALNLHVLWEVASGKACPDEEIPLFIMEMAIELAKFYIGQVKLVHSFSDEEGLAPGIVKLIELSKRLDANGKDGWIKAQQYRDLFAAKKRPSAEQARSLMLEAQSMGVGRTRGTGNRLEYHWLRDNDNNGDSPSSPTNNLGNSGKLREHLGKTLPVVETIDNKGIEDNLGNLGKGIPNSSLTKTNGCDFNKESCEEGGYVPAVSLSTTQESQEVELVGDIDSGDNLGKPFPNSSLSSLNDLKSTQEVIAAPFPACENPPQGTEAPDNVETPTAVVEDAPDATEALTTVETPQTPELDYNELTVRTNEELERLGWTNIEGRDHLIATYKRRSHLLLTDTELLDFLQYLEKQPTPSLVSETPPAKEEDAQQPLADVTHGGNVEDSVEEAIAPALVPTASAAGETPVTEEEWQVGERIAVEADGRVHQEFNECQGIIKNAEGHGSCFVEFDSGESAYILFRCLRRVNETACVNPSNGGI